MRTGILLLLPLIALSACSDSKPSVSPPEVDPDPSCPVGAVSLEMECSGPAGNCGPWQLHTLQFLLNGEPSPLLGRIRVNGAGGFSLQRDVAGTFTTIFPFHEGESLSAIGESAGFPNCPSQQTNQLDFGTTDLQVVLRATDGIPGVDDATLELWTVRGTRLTGQSTEGFDLYALGPDGAMLGSGPIQSTSTGSLQVDAAAITGLLNSPVLASFAPGLLYLQGVTQSGSVTPMLAVLHAVGSGCSVASTFGTSGGYGIAGRATTFLLSENADGARFELIHAETKRTEVLPVEHGQLTATWTPPNLNRGQDEVWSVRLITSGSCGPVASPAAVFMVTAPLLIEKPDAVPQPGPFKQQPPVGGTSGGLAG